jgi:hypothetical protein
MTETKSLFKSQEKKHDSKILYPFNSYTSLFYLIIIFPLMKQNIEVFDILGISIVISLTFSSLLWWGYKNKYVQIIDIISYSLLIFYIGFYYLNKYKNVLDIFIYLIFVIVYISIKKIELIRFFNISGVLFSLIVVCHYIKNIGEGFGLILLILSILNKFTDSFDIIDYNKLNIGSGTGWFHIFSAFGIYLIINNLDK